VALILEMRGIGKRFPGVIALDGVNLTVGTAEVVGLIGENGAGKSTLMKILGGVYQPDSGEIQIDGQLVRIHNVAGAMQHGIAFIHQELNVLDNLDVAGNVFLGREPRRGPLRLIDRRRIEEQTEPLLRRLGLKVSSRTPLRRLSLAQQQLVEIAKALSLNARILIMDEPTSSLTLAETDRLLELVLELQQQGVSIVYISHRLAELDRIADRVVGLRDGRNAGELSADEIHHDATVRMMVGRDIQSLYVEPTSARAAAYLRVRGARSRSYPDKPVSFEAGRGEILGFAGLVGAGRSELAEAIFGVAGDGGEVLLGDQRLNVRSVGDAIAQGIYLVPEDRRGTGLVTEMSVCENITLPSLRRHAVVGLVRRGREKETAERQKESLRIKTPTVDSLVVNLSGGNQQKVVLGKWLAMAPKVMILDEPTRGIDVGAKAEIHRLMRDLAAAGTVVLMISSDMEEILHVSDRVVVMHEGEIAGVLERPDCTEGNIMQLAVGRRKAAS
jgi:ribose transport system ATP-binding protein